MARPPKKDPPAKPAPKAAPAKRVTAAPIKAAVAKLNAALASKAAATATKAATPKSTTPLSTAAASPPARSAEITSPAPAALSIADVKLIRDRLDTLQPGAAVAVATPTDQLVAAMAEKLNAARLADQTRITELEAKLAALAEPAKADEEDRDAGLRDALQATDALLVEVSRLQLGLGTATTDLASARAQLDRAQREISELRASVDPKATGAHVLGAETVASLLNDFVGSFKGRINGLVVGGGEVMLKAGFAQLGDGAGFVLPTANAPASEIPVLHDIRLRLDPKG
jgi:hypothetical protein